jgi:hypothetical protein
MIAGLILAAVLLLALLAVGVWLMERARAEPAARASERAPDPTEEQEARGTAQPRSELLAESPRD